MEPVTVDQLLSWTGGSLAQPGAHPFVTSISTDSRTLAPGACFVPLAGQRFDGHQFIDEAVMKGAACIVASKDRGVAVSQDVGLILVDDTLDALWRIASGYRQLFTLPVVAITGSNGKTTTKEMVAEILSAMGPVIATEKNYNNEIGVPLTLLRIESRHRAAVVEMGMRKRGEIAQLARIAVPTIGVVTNVGPVHVEFLGSLEGVAGAKGELVEALDQDGYAVLNADDPYVLKMAARTRAQVVTFGLGADAVVRGERVEHRGLEGSRFILRWDGERVPIILKLPGRHQVINALAAAAVARCLGLDARAVQQGLIDVRTEMRMSLYRLGEGVILIDDAYNASPASVRSALLSLSDVKAKRRVAVLGGMLELGHLAEEAHKEVGELAARVGVDCLVAVGSEARWILDGALAAGLTPERMVHFSDASQAAAAVAQWSRAEDVILVKGSRGFRLEQVSMALKERFGPVDESEAEESR